jgi:hypothetical protein
VFAGFERKAFIPAFKQSCFVDSWQSALKAMTWGDGGHEHETHENLTNNKLTWQWRVVSAFRFERSYPPSSFDTVAYRHI